MSFDRTIARMIDHTILKPDATRAEVQQVCADALRYEFASVCVNGCWVPLVKSMLDASPVKVCSVVGFPLGAMDSRAKVAEALFAVTEGAQEIDMVMNIGALRGGQADYVYEDILAVAEAIHEHNAILKVILETALLDDAQKTLACSIAQQAGADFVKTSTGFAKSGANKEDVALMRRVVGPDMGVKASGGIRSLSDLRVMIAAGANRIGASASVQIVQASAQGKTAPADAANTY